MNEQCNLSKYFSSQKSIHTFGDRVHCYAFPLVKRAMQIKTFSALLKGGPVCLSFLDESKSVESSCKHCKFPFDSVLLN